MFKILQSCGLISVQAEETPLHIACYNGYLDIVKVLHEAGADVSIKTKPVSACS